MKKMYTAKKGTGGLHLKGKTGKGKLSVGAKSKAKSLAETKGKIILGSGNRGKTGRMDAM